MYVVASPKTIPGRSLDLRARRLRCLVVVVGLAGITASVSCGGGAQPPASPPPISIAINQTSVSLAQGASQTFSAIVTQTTNTAVTWSVQEGTAGGRIDSAGVYTAPDAAGTFHVVATSQADPSKSATATITVSEVVISLSPATLSLSQGGTQTFTPTVTGTIHTGVSWSVQEGAAGGSVSPAGTYTAPNAAGVFHVIATSQTNPNQSAVATVTVSEVTVSISPPSATLAFGDTQSFGATVSGHVNPAVTWSVQEGPAGGTINPSGVYTAPNTPGTFHVVATSQGNPGRSTVATVTVATVNIVDVSILVYSTATMPQGGMRRFTARVTGASQQDVTWSVLEGAAGGTISPSGLYTAPNRPGIFHITATAQANPSRSASVAVTVADVAVHIDFIFGMYCLGGASRVTAAVTGTVNTGVTWSLQEGGTAAHITSDGIFTCTVATGTFHIVATSVQDPSKSATAVMDVIGPPTGSSNTIAIMAERGLPSAVPQQTIVPHIYVMLAVGGTADQRVTWNSSALTAGDPFLGHATVTFTASLQPGTYDIVATPVADPTRSGTWTVTVAPLGAIPIQPTAEILGPGLQRTFMATTTVTYPYSNRYPFPLAVTWSASAGSIDSNGVFTAPTVPGTYTVTASTSLPPLTATSTVTVAGSGYFASGATIPRIISLDPLTATLLPTGLVLLYGGAGVPFSFSQIYDPASASLTMVSDAAAYRSGHTATLLPDGRVLLAGGLAQVFCTSLAGCHASPANSADLYDPVSGTITPTGSMTAARAWHTATLMPNGRVLITGGGIDANHPASLLSSAEEYDSATGTFSAVGSMTVPRCLHTATLLPNGKVLIAGGSLSGPAELYDPVTATFSAGASMMTNRVSATATLLPDGTVLLAGGTVDTSANYRTASTELYDPVSGVFVSSGAMAVARSGHAAALLPNGKVLVVGGSDDRSAELYTPSLHSFEPTGGTEYVHGAATLTVLPDGTVLVFGSAPAPEIYFPQPRP